MPVAVIPLRNGVALEIFSNPLLEPVWLASVTVAVTG